MQRNLFDDVHEDFRASFRTFLEREVVGEDGRYGEWEREGIVPREVYALAGRGGFLGMAVPEQYGGAGAEDFRFNLIVGEECQRAGVASLGLGITLHNDISLPYFLSYCTEQQRERWLPGIVSGELITAIAMTEPGIGSDLASMTTRAKRDGDHYDRCTQALDAGELTAEDAATAKWWCTDLQGTVADRCLQLFGGYGYMSEYPIARAYADARVTRIYGGANEIMKEIVGRSLGL
jgi:alkylation response protein AidB-like acyl-CoA dehydrogenase